MQIRLYIKQILTQTVELLDSKSRVQVLPRSSLECQEFNICMLRKLPTELWTQQIDGFIHMLYYIFQYLFNLFYLVFGRHRSRCFGYRILGEFGKLLGAGELCRSTLSRIRHLRFDRRQLRNGWVPLGQPNGRDLYAASWVVKDLKQWEAKVAGWRFEEKLGWPFMATLQCAKGASMYITLTGGISIGYHHWIFWRYVTLQADMVWVPLPMRGRETDLMLC